VPDRRDIEPVPPCRVLWRDGKLLDEPELITERPRLVENYKRTDITPVPPSLYVPHGDTIHGRVSQPRKRAGRPRVNPPKQQPHKGRGKAWNRIEAITDQQIVSMRESGETWRQIGEALGIDPSTAHKRFYAAREKQAASAKREQVTTNL
jgi:hypothetical protein